MELRAHWLSLLAGVTVQPLQMRQEDPTVDACLREFGAEIDLEEFMTGRARPSRLALLYHGPHVGDRPVLYELSTALEEHLKRALQ